MRKWEGIGTIKILLNEDHTYITKWTYCKNPFTKKLSSYVSKETKLRTFNARARVKKAVFLLLYE